MNELQISIFCGVPASSDFDEFHSDGQGQLVATARDSHSAIGALLIRVTDLRTDRNLDIKYSTIFENWDGVLVRSDAERSNFVPSILESCQFTRALAITLSADDDEEYGIEYTGTLSYFGNRRQDALPRMKSGQLLGHDIGQGAPKEWLSKIEFSIWRK